MLSNSKFSCIAGIAICVASLFTPNCLRAQALGGYYVAGMNGYQTTTSTTTFASAYYSNSGGSGVSKQIHLKINSAATGDSIILVSDTTGFQAICRSKSNTWISVQQKTLGVTPNYSGARNGFALSSSDTSIVIEIKHDRTSTMASDTPKSVRILYKRSSNQTINSSFYDFAPRIYTLSNVYRWTGATDKDFTKSTNWIPERSSPATSDLLIFDQYDTADVEIVNTGSKINQEIGQLMITNFTKVRFTNYRNNGDNSISTLILGTANTNQHNWAVGSSGGYPTIPTVSWQTFDGDLTLGEGSSLIVSGTDTVCFNFKTGATIKTNFSGARTIVTKKDKGNGAVMKFYFTDDITDNGVLRYFSFKNEVNTAIYFDGDDNSILGIGEPIFSGTPTASQYIGGDGSIVIGPRTAVSFPDIDNNSKWYLGGKLVVLGRVSGNIVSNSPSANTESAWNSWEPYLQIVNDGTHKGSIGDQKHNWISGANHTITGGVKWQMYNSGNRAWRTVGFPFAEMYVSQISRNIVVTGTKNATNKDSFYSFNSSCSHCRTSLYSWDESSSEWTGFESGTTANKLTAGQGVLLFFRGLGDQGLGDASASATAGVMNFKGTPIVGDKTVNLSYNAGGGTLQGVNLVSNPYMSNIDWSKVSRTNVADKFYFYDPAGKMYNVYDNTGGTVVVNGTNAYKNGTTTETRTIEQGAAFFVVATGSSPSITFQENDKISSKGSASAFREERTFPCNRLAMSLTSADPSKIEMDHATLEWDMTEKGAVSGKDFMDMPKIYGGYYGIGSVGTDGTWNVIDRRPDLTEGVLERINLKVASHEKNGNYKISFETCNEKTSTEIILVDLLKGTKTNINSGLVYDFTKAEGDVIATEQRFVIELLKTDQKNNLSSVNQLIGVYPNPVKAGDGVYLATDASISLLEATLLDLNGKVVKEWQKQDVLSAKIDLPVHLKEGIYILKLNSNKGVSCQKLQIDLR